MRVRPISHRIAMRELWNTTTMVAIHLPYARNTLIAKHGIQARTEILRANPDKIMIAIAIVVTTQEYNIRSHNNNNNNNGGSRTQAQRALTRATLCASRSPVSRPNGGRASLGSQRVIEFLSEKPKLVLQLRVEFEFELSLGRSSVRPLVGPCFWLHFCKIPSTLNLPFE